MTESIITLSIVGLLAGFILSMPVAGPISILITSNALKGRLRYCKLATIGASIADFVFIFIAVFGITKAYSFYQPYIPYVLLAGAIFLGFIGYKIFKTEIDLEHPADSQLAQKIKQKGKGGFLTGFLVSFLNPSLFISWMMSSFFIISFVASLGFNTGGLDKNVDDSITEFKKIERHDLQNPESNASSKTDTADTLMIHSKAVTPVPVSKYSPLFLSLSYSFFVSLGSIFWFFYLAWFIVKHRHRINIKFITRLIQAFGLILLVFGAYFAYKGIHLLAYGYI